MARRVIDLNGDEWRLGQAPPGAGPHCPTWDEMDRVGRWLPAVVPGSVQADLVRAGLLPDPCFGRQARAARRADQACWWLVRRFPLSVALPDRAHLVLRGVDYIGDLFLNGHALGRHEGMFSPQTHEITGLLHGENVLAVRILGNAWLPDDRSTPGQRLLNRLEAAATGLGRPYPHRRDTLKCQMGFGWDFAPPLPAMGIWDDVYAVVTGPVLLRDAACSTRLAGDEAALSVAVEIDARQACEVRLRLELAGATFPGGPPLVHEGEIQLPAGPSRHTVELAVPRPRLWWPWDHGRPDLYDLAVELRRQDEILDRASLRVGLREVELRDMALHVNGRRVMARGANWVPADLFPGRVTAADYRVLLALAREANMNLLRVWGGGLREKRAFYAECDRLGIMLWQEFPLACAFLARFPRSDAYLRLVDGEVQAIVRDLRNHPSVVLWCGGNEWSPERNAPLVQALRGAVDAQDASRPFLPASPVEGDSHNWQVWHRFEPPSAYRGDPARFASEFGLQAPPDVPALRRFIPADELWPPGPSWAFHGAGLRKLRRYARPFLRGATTLESFVEASQRAQAYGLQVAIEHYRRRAAAGCGGVLVWQLNEPWPAVSWSLLGHDRAPKPAYRLVRRLFAPVLVSADLPLLPYRAGDRLTGAVWLVHDGAEALPGCRLAVALWDQDGRLADRMEQAADLPAGGALPVARVEWTLPPGETWRLTCRLEHDGRVLAENDYDLGVHDGLGPTPRQRLASRLRDRLAR